MYHLDLSLVDKILNQKNIEKYTLTTYDKHALTPENVKTMGLFRSVIHRDGKVVCFSPPKSVDSEVFIATHPLNECVAEQFIEGTMINVFHDDGEWKISTKNCLGARTQFNKEEPMTYREMFFEAIQFSLDTLNTKYCYSFVLQHPKNRIVIPFEDSQIYLVACYEIYEDNSIVYIEPESIQLPEVHIPIRYVHEMTYAELKEKYASYNNEYDSVGVMIRHIGSGDRMKFRNPNYEQVRQLRGNDPKIQYRFICLHQKERIVEYLNYYPEDKDAFEKFGTQLRNFTKQLHLNYMHYFVLKICKKENISKQYQRLMFELHSIYLTQLRSEGRVITYNYVMKYLKTIHPAQLMYSLNYHLRKNKGSRNMDMIN